MAHEGFNFDRKNWDRRRQSFERERYVAVSGAFDQRARDGSGGECWTGDRAGLVSDDKREGVGGAVGSSSTTGPGPVFTRMSIPPSARRIHRWHRIRFRLHGALGETAQTRRLMLPNSRGCREYPGDPDGIGPLGPVPWVTSSTHPNLESVYGSPLETLL